MPRFVNAKKVTFKYGLGDEFIEVLKTLSKLGLDKIEPVEVRSSAGMVEVSPRDVVAALLPNPAKLGPQMKGKTWIADSATALIDEDPRAYKDIKQVMADQSDLTEVVHVLTQVLNYKGTS